jgi:hypothetical protein
MVRGLFCNKLFKKPNAMTQNLDDFIYVVILPNFWQTLAQPTDHPQKWPNHLWRDLFILYTPDVLSFGLNVLKMKFFDIEFHFFFLNPYFWRIFYNESHLVLGYRKLSLSIIDNFGLFLIIELSIIRAKIIDNSR